MLSELPGTMNAGGGPIGRTLPIPKRKTPQQDHINPKLKQFFRKQIEMKPFYSGGKICVLSPCTFACQCGPAVNVISTAATVKSKQDRDENDEEEMNSKESLTAGCFQIIAHLETELDEIFAFDACPSTRVLVTAHKSSLLRLWDLDQGQVIKTIKSLHNLPISLLEFDKSRASLSLRNALQGRPRSRASSTSSLVESDSEDAVIMSTLEDATSQIKSELVWSTVSGAIVKVWEVGGNQMSKAIQVKNIASIGFSKWDDVGERKRLFVAERNIYIIAAVTSGKVSQYEITHTLEGHYSQVTGIEFADNIMISGGRDKVLILWDMEKAFARLKTISLKESIESIALLNSKTLYIAMRPNVILRYDIQKNMLTKSSVLKEEVDEPIVAFYSSLVNVEDGTRDSFFASTHSSVLFEIEEDKETSNQLTISKQYVGFLDEILCIVIWGDQQVAVANNTNIIKIYNLKTGQCNFLRGHKDIVLSLDTHKKWLVSGSKDNCVILWKRDSEKPQIVLVGHLASVTAVCFSAIDFLVYSVSEDNFLKVWDKTKCVKSQLAHDKEIHTVNCSPNGALVITSSRDKTAKIWDAETLGLVAALKGHKKSVWDARFSAWDQLAVTSSADTTIKVWSLMNFTCIQTLQGHTSSVLQAIFVNGGLQIISSSSDATFRVWDLKSSDCIFTEECGEDKIWTLAAEPDASVVITGSADSIITVWQDVTDERVKESLAKRRKLVEDEQKLNNVLKSGQWQEAFRLAIELDRPFTMLKIIRELKNPSELMPIVQSLSFDLKSQMVDYIKKWNTNTKTSTEAQYLLNTLLKTTSFSLLEDMPTESLIAYTQKHFSRLKTHREHVAVIKYFANKDEITS